MGDKKVKGKGKERGVIFKKYEMFKWIKVSKKVELGIKDLEDDLKKEL